MLREKEKPAHQSYKYRDNKKILDWKLDYRDSGVHKEFKEVNNAQFVPLFRQVL